MSMSGRASGRTMDDSSVVIVDPVKAHDMPSSYAHSGLLSSPGGGVGDGEERRWEWAFPFRTVLGTLLLLALYSSIVVSVSLFSSPPTVPVCSPTDLSFPCQVLCPRLPSPCTVTVQ